MFFRKRSSKSSKGKNQQNFFDFPNIKVLLLQQYREKSGFLMRRSCGKPSLFFLSLISKVVCLKAVRKKATDFFSIESQIESDTIVVVCFHSQLQTLSFTLPYKTQLLTRSFHHLESPVSSSSFPPFFLRIQALNFQRKLQTLQNALKLLERNFSKISKCHQGNNAPV